MTDPTPARYTVCDGDLTLTLEAAEEGGFVVTCPFDPALITEGDTLEEAFAMARDAREELRAFRADRAAGRPLPDLPDRPDGEGARTTRAAA